MRWIARRDARRGLRDDGATATATTPAAIAGKVSRQEQAATLFDAALHRDRLRLKLLVDWSRYRLTWAWARAMADHAEATTGLSQVEAEPSPSEAYVEMAVGELQARLAAVAGGTAAAARRDGRGQRAARRSCAGRRRCRSIRRCRGCGR